MEGRSRGGAVSSVSVRRGGSISHSKALDYLCIQEPARGTMPRLSLLSTVDKTHKEPHSGGVWTAAWTSGEDGASQRLITGSVDETVQLWHETEDRALESRHKFTGHSLGVLSVSTTGTIAASSALDSIIRVWDMVTGLTKAIIECPPAESWSIAFNPVAVDPPLIAVAGGSSNKVKIWSVKDASEKAVLALPTQSQVGQKSRTPADVFSLSVSISPDGKRLAAGGMDGTVAVFDLETATLLHGIQGHSKAVRSLEFTPDSKQLLTASDDMHLHLYDVEQASLIDAFSGHSSWVLDVSCHPSGQCFASGSSDASVKLWDMSTRTCAQTINQHTDQVWGVTFRGDGTRLASVSDDQSIALYEHTA